MCAAATRTGCAAWRQKALSVGSNPDGGYLVPAETETEITRLMTAISPIRAIAGIRQISSATYKKPISIAGAATGWAAETASRDQTASPTLDELSFPAAELYAMPAATSAFLDDAAVDVGQWIADEVNAAFAAQEGTAFVIGDGTNKPKGFLSETQVAEANWAWGKLGYVATGVAGDFPASDPSDALVDLVYALKAGYRQNASWVMNRKTQGLIRKFKDAEGNYLWQPARHRRRPGHADGLPAGRGRGHARHRRRRHPHRLRRFPPRLSDGRPAGCQRAARPVSRPSPTCCSTPPSASAVACRISTPSSS